MPIPTRQPEVTGMPTFPPSTTRVPAAKGLVCVQGSPGDLLALGDILAPAPVPAPARALALDALRLIRAIRDPDRRPVRWARPGFGREIEMVRRHLAPVRSRRALAVSFGQEAFHLAPTIAERDDPSAIRLAYALRWMELRDGVIAPTWPMIMGAGD